MYEIGILKQYLELFDVRFGKTNFIAEKDYSTESKVFITFKFVLQWEIVSFVRLCGYYSLQSFISNLIIYS